MAFSHETRLQIVIITVMVMVIGAVATESAVAVQASLGDDGGTGISIDERSGVDGDTTSIVAALKADAAIMLREGDAPICGRLSSENTIRTLLDGQMAQRAHAALCSTSALVQTQNAESESGHDARVELRDGHYRTLRISDRQYGDDDASAIFAESALRLVANLLRSKKLAALVETLKRDNTVRL